MARVQRTPRGLLALLGIVGENPPNEISGEYRAVIESRDLVTAELETGLGFGNNAAAAAGGTALATVPPNEMHVLIGAVAAATIPAGPPTFIGLSVDLSVRGNSISLAYNQRSSADGALTVGRNVSARWQPSGLLVLNPGDSIVAVLNELTGAATLSLTAIYTFRRIPI